MSHNVCLLEPIVSAQDVIDYRKSLRLSQAEFAEKFHVPLGTIRNWEQGLSKPNISLAKLQVCNQVIEWAKMNRQEAA